MGGDFQRVSGQFQGLAKKKWPLTQMCEQAGLDTWLCGARWLKGRKGGNAGGGSRQTAQD